MFWEPPILSEHESAMMNGAGCYMDPMRHPSPLSYSILSKHFEGHSVGFPSNTTYN